MEQRRVLITECYSPQNLGDGELVDATIAKAALDLSANILALVALDTEGVSKNWPTHRVVRRLFDRSRFAAATKKAKFPLLASWAVFIALQSVASVTPRTIRSPLSRRLLVLSPSSMRESADLYLRCTHVVPVGGGYLGEKYLRETLLTIWTWWWSDRLGKRVLTMPMSVEANSKSLQLAYRVLLRGIRVTARDPATFKVLTGADVETQLVPDLAFRNFRGSRAAGVKTAAKSVVVIPVGSDYYSEPTWKWQLDQITRSLSKLRGDHQMAVYSMHRKLPGSTHAGYDEEAVQFLLDSSAAPVVDLRSEIQSYSGLCTYLRENASLLITARMHGGIAGLCAGVPVVMLGYEQKHRSLMDQLEIPDLYGDFGRCDEAEISRMFCNALEKSTGAVTARVGKSAHDLRDWELEP